MAKNQLLKKLAKNALGKEGKLRKLLLSKGLPLLANTLTGGAAKPVIALINNHLGVESDNIDDLEKSIKDNPEMLVKLKEFEATHAIELEKLTLQATQLEVEKMKISTEDIQDARSRELEIMEKTGKRDWLLMSLAIVVVLGFFGLIYIMITGEQDVKDNSAVNQLFGALVAGFSMVLSYFFGSSQGSADKHKTINRQMMANNPNSNSKFNNAKG